MDKGIVHCVHAYGDFIRIFLAQGVFDSDGYFSENKDIPRIAYEIRGEAYTNFMQENQETGKPANTFRTNDLWAIVQPENKIK